MNADTYLTWMPSLLGGLWLSIQLAAGSFALGSVLGVALALLMRSRLKAVRWSAVVIVELGRGTPALVVLYLVYFGLPDLGASLPRFLSAVVALGITVAAYTSEMFRAGLSAVPEGQGEASAALGMSAWDSLTRVVGPQALRVALPSVAGYAIINFQTTALAYTIALPELLSRAYSIGSSTFRYLEVLALAGFLYLVITIPGGWFVRRMERRLSAPTR